MSDYITSLIRTWVPIAVGFALTWLATKLKIVIYPESTATVTAVSVSIVSGAYYSLVRWLETKSPQFGWLLGKAKAPSYVPEDPPAAGGFPLV